MSDSKDIFLTFIFSSLAGAIAGILCAPKSGKETRHDIKKLLKKVTNTLGDLNETLTETGRKNCGEAKEKNLSFQDKINKTSEECGKKD
jgi:gas vesicle protein